MFYNFLYAFLSNIDLDIDLEEYHDKFRAIGVKKIKHLEDCKDEHLVKIGMLELEIARFWKKICETFKDVGTSPQPPAPKENTLQVQMPSSAFGHSVLDITEGALVREYGALWYEEPQNFKQKSSNGFILKMCSAAAWQFSTKKDLYMWARNERDLRWNALLSFAECKEVEEETPYFQKQSILYCLEDLNRQNIYASRAVEEKNLSPQKRNYPQVEAYVGELIKLGSWAQNGLIKAEKMLSSVKGKPGHAEEEFFWGSLLKKAQKIVALLEEKVVKAKIVQQTYYDLFGENNTPAQKAAILKKQKNLKKNAKRRAESKMESQAGSRKVLKKGGNVMPIKQCLAMMSRNIPLARNFRPGICMRPLSL